MTIAMKNLVLWLLLTAPINRATMFFQVNTTIGMKQSLLPSLKLN
jgi:hypothetical protein